MKCVDNTYLDKLEFLPDEVELAVPKSWCYSAISIMERMELCEELIYMINSCIYSGEHKHDSPGNVSKYVKMSVGNVKKIIRICGKETLCYILPYNYEKLSIDFLCNTLGELKNQIENFVDLEKYDDPNIRYYVFVVDKNRAGSKPKLVFRLVNQFVGSNPGHHGAQLCTNLLDRMLGIQATA